MLIHNAVITGSLTYNGVDISDITGSEASISALNSFSASMLNYTASNNVASASFSTRVVNLESTASVLTTASASFAIVSQSYASASGSLSTRVTNTETTASSLVTASGSFSTRVTNLELTGSSLVAASASFSTRVVSLESTASVLTTASSSFAQQSGSNSVRLTNLESTASVLTTASASFAVVSSSFASTSGSDSRRITNLESTASVLTTASASFAVVSSSYSSASGSLSTRVTTIEGSYATTGSNTFTGVQNITNIANAISFTSTGSLYTDGGARITKDLYVSGTSYFNNVTIYGTQSVNYITSSQLNIGTNIITVNTDTPTVRYGGIAVYDSGSTGLTGSLLWDSEQNHWIYTNPSGSTYSGGMIMSGPRASARGCEVGTTSCALMMGQGGDHITSSAIFHYGNATCFYGTSIITSTGVGCFSGAVCASSVASAGTITGTSGTFSSTLSSNSDFTVNTNKFIVTAATGNTSVGGTLNVTGQACASSVLSSGTICSTGNTCFGGMSVVASCLGIGTATPNQKLQVYDATVARILVGTNTTFTDPYSAFPAQNISAIQVISSNVGGAQLQLGYTNTCSGCGIGGIHFMTTGTSASEKRGALIASELEASSATNVTANLVFYTNITGTIGERMRIASTGQVCFACTICAPMVLASGCAGIGTTSPQAKLDIGGTGDSTLFLSAPTGAGGLIKYTYNGVQQWYVGTNAAGGGEQSYTIYGYTTNNLNIVTNSAERLRITSTGEACFACQVCAPAFVGGTVTGTRMTVATDCSGVIVDVASRHGLMKYFNYSTGLVGCCTGTDGAISTWLGRFAGSITAPTAVYQDLVVTNTGNVGIGASQSPVYMLEVSSTGGSQRIRVGTLQNNDNTPRFEAITSNGVSVANSAWLRVDDGGGFTLGQSDYTKTGGDSGNFANISSEVQSPRITVLGSGDVGINETSPSTYGRFTVNTGTSCNTPSLFALGYGTSLSNLVLRNNYTRANGILNGIEFRDNSNEVQASIYACATGANNQSVLIFGTNNGTGGNGLTNATERMRITNSGNVGIGTTSISSTYGTLTVAGTGISIADDGNAKLQIGRYSAAACNAYIKMGTNACSLRFTNAADTVDVVVIEKGGNVGIGTSAPGKILNVAANDSTSGNYQARSAVIRIQNTNDAAANSRFAGTQFSFSPGASTGDNYVIGAIGAVLTDSSTQWSGDLVFAVKNATTATTLTEYARIFTGGVACFACQVCVPKLQINAGPSCGTLNITGYDNGGINIIDQRTATSGCYYSSLTFRDYYLNNSAQIRFYHNQYFGSGVNSLRIAFEDSEKFLLTYGGVACFSSTVCTMGVKFVGLNLRVSTASSAGNSTDPAITSGGCTKVGIYFAGGCIGLGAGGNGVLLAPGGHLVPEANGTQDLGSSNCRWCTVYTSDLSLSNGIGNYTIVEGENDLFLYNNNSCKVYKFVVQEVCPEIAPAKRSL